MGRALRPNKLVPVSVTLEPEVKELLITLAKEAGMYTAAFGAECLLLGLSLKSGRSINELLEDTRRHTNGTSYDART